MYYAKKRIKASIFRHWSYRQGFVIKNNYHIYLPIIGVLYAGAMFGIGSLIGINCWDW
jgi:hypothetical protein